GRIAPGVRGWPRGRAHGGARGRARGGRAAGRLRPPDVGLHAAGGGRGRRPGLDVPDVRLARGGLRVPHAGGNPAASLGGPLRLAVDAVVWRSFYLGAAEARRSTRA